MDNYALEVNNVTKVYKLYKKQTDRLREAFDPFRRDHHSKFYALDGVSFRLKVGEKIGIIGSNGAGKSTLLKIITGVLSETEGSVSINGKVAALLELGAGFNPDYTGLENIYLNGTLMGYSSEEMNEKAARIIEFADIGDFIDQPVKSYSSGMFVRLAFATQIFSEPDILIVDEALSVGDIRFQQKCFRAMESIMRDKTVILVTHDPAAVTRFCHRVLWINKGKVMYDGEVTEGLKQYQGFILQQQIEEKARVGASDFDDVGDGVGETEKAQPAEIPPVLPSVTAKGRGDAHITHCALLDGQGIPTELIEPRSRADFVMRVSFDGPVSRPIIGITVRDRLGNEVFSLNSAMTEQEIGSAEGVREYHIAFDMPALNKGEYLISPAVAQGYQEDHIQLCWLDDAWVFRVKKRKFDLPGMIYLDRADIKEMRVD